MTEIQFMICFLGYHKITLIIVVRDKHPGTPVVIIEKKVKQSIGQIWTNIRKPEGLQDKEFDDCLDVKVVVMHSYVHEKDKFVKEVSVLLDVIVWSQGRKTYSPRQFASEAQKQWQMINEHPELNIQTYKESIDQNRCNELTRKYIRSFEEELRKLERRPTGFSGHEVGKIVHHFLEEYNEATRSFTASVTSKEQETLKYELLKYSVKQNTTLSLVKDSFIAALLAGAVTVDAVVAGGTATLALLGTAAAVTGGAAALAGGVAAAHAYPIFGAVKKVCNGANFFIKNRNYRPEKPSASDNLEKP